MINLEKIKQTKPIQELLEFSIINVNKPSRITSFGVVERIKNILGVTKTGHFGTLDLKVTGVLPIALGRACRLCEYFMHHDKVYVGKMHLHSDISKEILKQEMKKFNGRIMQKPPVKSAVKRVLRPRTINKFEITEKNERDVSFIADVEAGTYIRKLCLHPDTELLTENGLIKIKDFYLNPIGIFSNNNYNLQIKKPIEMQKIDSFNKLIKLKMSSGIEIIATPDHKFLASKNNGYEMIKCEKLKSGDYLVKTNSFPIKEVNYNIADFLDDDYLIEQPEVKEECKKSLIQKFGSIRAMNRELKLDRKAFLLKSKCSISIKHLKLSGIYEQVKYNLKIFKTPKGKLIEINQLTSDHFYLLGLIASDGNNTKENNTIRLTRIKFHNANEQLIDKFKDIYERLFPTIPISKKKIRPNLFQLDSSNSLLASIAGKLGIISPNKYSDILPILYCKKDFIKSFLRGYFDGDGTAYVNKKKNSTITYSRIVIFSANYTNTKRIHQMLLRLSVNNKILKNKMGIYIIDVNSISSKKKFINEIGSNHPKKIEIFNKINNIYSKSLLEDELYMGFHYKEFIKKNKSKLSKMRGNLQRILSNKIPMTKGFYRRCSKIIELPELDDFIIEKINKIELMDSFKESVFDMTIPETHNFLIETGFISSNCSDLGENIGGAHMIELRRMRAGLFKEENSYKIEEITKAFELYKEKGNETKLREILIPAEIIIELLPIVQVKNEEKIIKDLLNGITLKKQDLEDEKQIPDSNLFLVFAEDKFIGIYEKINEIENKERIDKTKNENERENEDKVAKVKFVLN